MAIQIRSYKKNDIDGILELLNNTFKAQQHFNITRDISWWNWKYRDNVFGEPIVIVAEDDDKIVGARCLWPWLFNCRGQQIKAYQPVDTAVYDEYQGQRIFSKMNVLGVNEAIKSGTKVIFNFPNKNSLPGNLRLGWQYVSKLTWRVKIRRPFNILSYARSKEKSNPLEPLEKLTVEDCKVKYFCNFDGILKTLKNEEFLVWRYLHNPFFRYGVIRSDRIIGIYSFTGNNNRKELTIVDIIGDKNRFKELLSKIDLVANSLGADFVAILQDSEMISSNLYRNGYLKVKKKNLVALPLDLVFENKVVNYNNWSVFGGLHDSL